MTINFTLNAGNNIALNLPTSQTIKTVTSQANTINIIKATAGTVTVSDINNIGNVVVTNPTDTQLLQFNGSNWVNIAADTVGGGGTLDSAITISNADSSFAHMTTPIASGTSLEAVLRDMLEMYNLTTITLTSYSRALQNTDGSYGAYATDSTSGDEYEVGRGVRIQAVTYTIETPSQTTDNSVILYGGAVGTTQIQSGMADTGGTVTLSSVHEIDPIDDYTTTRLKMTAVDSGGGSDSTITTASSKYIYHKFKVKAGITTTTTIANAPAAQTLFDGIDTSPGVDELASDPGSSGITITADATYNSSGNYVIMAFPQSWGAISAITLDGAYGVLGAFTDLGDFNITNAYGAVESYSFYRGTEGAYTNGQTIKFSF